MMRKPARTIRRHDANAVPLVFGMIFLAVAATWLAAVAVSLSGRTFGVIAATALVASGLVGMAVALWPKKSGDDADD